MKAFTLAQTISSCWLLLFTCRRVVSFCNAPGPTTALTHLSATSNRRAFLASSCFIATVGLSTSPAIGADRTVQSLLAELVESRDKLQQVPDLLQASQWDSVRTILKNPPINNLWNMGDGKNPLLKIAQQTDAFDLLELKDELALSLQMCDQLTYDNVFVYYQPGNGKVKIKEPTDLALKALSQLSEAISVVNASST